MWLTKLKDQYGQAMVEMVIVLPLLLFIVFSILEFGNIYSRQLQINNVARNGARTAAIGALTDAIIEADMLASIGGTATGRNTDITRDSGTGTVTSSVTCQVQVYTPFVSVFTGNPMVLQASVTMRVE